MAFAPLKERYKNEVATSLMEDFGYENVMQVPRITKIVVNVGLGEALDNAKAIEFATNDIMQITGQKPVVTRAKKSIAAFLPERNNRVKRQVVIRLGTG